MDEAPEKIDFIVKKKTKFYKEFQLTEDDGIVPISLVGKKIRCVIKKSYSTTTSLFNLTEANGGTARLDAANGVFSIVINSNATDIPVNKAVYDIYIDDDENPTTDTECFITGNLIFMEGA